MRFRGDFAAAKVLCLAAICSTVASQAVTTRTKEETITSLSSMPDLSSRLKTYGPDVCGGWRRNSSAERPLLLLLIAVDSAAAHADARQEIRYAWRAWLSAWTKNVGGGRGGDDDVDVRLVFFAGKPRGRRAAQRLRAENESVGGGGGGGGGGDVVWTNVTETDRHESLKAVSLLRWVRSECPAARFVLRVAEHVIVNPAPLLDFVRLNAGATNTVWGYERRRFWPVENGPESYCDWPAYLMTSDVVDVMYRGSMEPIDYFEEQNVFITGTVAKNKNVNVTYVDQFQGIVLSNTPAPAGVNVSDSNCYYFKNHMIFVTFFDKNEWAYLMNKYLNCLKCNNE